MSEAKAKPKPKLLSKRARKWTLWVHVLSSALWLGSALAMTVLLVARGSRVDDPFEVYAFCLGVKLIDDWLIIGSCGLSAVSGVVLGWKTPWGLFKYWWVAVKLVVTLVLLSSGASLLGPWINETEALVRDQRAAALAGPRYASLHGRVLILGSIQIAILGFIMWASIFKPWGKRRPRD